MARLTEQQKRERAAAKLARRGSRLLTRYQKRIPDRWSRPWFKVVMITRLNMRDPWLCVLGQLFGFYFDGAELVLCDKADRHSEHHGFNNPTLQFVTYDDLTAAWKDEIRRLRKGSTNG